ncbi:MAG: ferritin family protein [Candidatus Aminicenantes bacterium]|nr:MAG: ferritin family protein [Candidatus Aminicenantes bacterium]
MTEENLKNDLPACAVLAAAIRSEIEAADVYSKLHERVKNTLLKEKLKFLISEEKKHRKILERLYSQRYADQKLEIPEKSGLPPVKVKMDEKSSVLELFNVALETEKSSEGFYRKGSESAKEENTRRILRYLSRVERTHFFMIKSEIDLLERFPEYYDVEDFHFGSDMVHMGP